MERYNILHTVHVHWLNSNQACLECFSTYDVEYDRADYTKLEFSDIQTVATKYFRLK